MTRRKRKNGSGFGVIFTGVKNRKPFARNIVLGGKVGGFGTRREAEIARRIVFKRVSSEKKKKFKLRSRIVKL